MWGDTGDLKSDVLELKQRVGRLEKHATMSGRLDRIDMRLDQVERRPDLIAA